MGIKFEQWDGCGTEIGVLIVIVVLGLIANFLLDHPILMWVIWGLGFLYFVFRKD